MCFSTEGREEIRKEHRTSWQRIMRKWGPRGKPSSPDEKARKLARDNRGNMPREHVFSEGKRVCEERQVEIGGIIENKSWDCEETKANEHKIEGKKVVFHLFADTCIQTYMVVFF